MNNEYLGRKIGIIGVGMVGGAHKRYYESMGAVPQAYDPSKGFNNAAVLNDCDIILVCVPTPYIDEKGGFDLTYVESALNLIPSGKIAVIKSTVIPGTTDKLQEKYPELCVIFSPEFLSEATADQDVKNPIRQIVGHTEKSKPHAEAVMKILPRAKFEKIVRAKEAEMVKYFGNAWYATKVIFANQIYDLCQKLAIDYEVVKECVKPEPMVGGSHLEVFHKGYRGYGGSCLPKDVSSLIQLGDSHGINMELLKKVEEINKRLNGGRKK